MSSLLGIHSISKAYGSQILFENISFTVSSGDRIGLIGPNGSGKSTLLKMLAALETCDSGQISRKQGLHLGIASQVPDFCEQSIENVLLKQDDLYGDEIERVTKARILLRKFEFSDYTQGAHTLSGGWKKRLDIAKAFMKEPDLLLLDEPTNHLDLESILWLEKFLSREKISYIIVSHDRYFLENVSNKIIELNKCYPGGMFISAGNLSTFMEHKEAFIESQLQQERSLSSTVRDEVEWLKKSPKARTKKSRSRIQKASELLDELAEVRNRNRTKKIAIDFSTSERETRKLLTAKNLTKSISGTLLFKGIDLVLSPGMRLGIVGRNGTGKTTLLKILAQELAQDMGTIKYADDLRVVYFDQHRETILPHISLREALSPNSDFVQYRGENIHVHGWAKKFLFPQERLALPVKYLSGGERARILLAQLMQKRADILFLDEPTNDLDIATLEVIEESLKEFLGAVVLISHDRCLMDRICTHILGLGKGNEQELFADYKQWENTTPQLASTKEGLTQSSAAPVKHIKKLSYQELQELQGMEENIMRIENELSLLQQQLETFTLQTDHQTSVELYTLLAEKEKTHNHLFERWQYLVNKSTSTV